MKSYLVFSFKRAAAQLDAGRVFARRTSEPIPTRIAVLAIWMGFSGTWWNVVGAPRQLLRVAARMLHYPNRSSISAAWQSPT